MKSFVLADLADDINITIAKKDFSLKKGMSYRFNFADKNSIKEVLKYLTKHKGVFRYLETNSFVNCFQTFSLAKDRFSTESSKLSNNFKSKKKSEAIIKVARDEEDEGRGALPDDFVDVPEE